MRADPFRLPKRLSCGIEACTGKSFDEVTYLWLNFSLPGHEQGNDAAPICPELGLDQWLNVIDEAASLGVAWLVVSVKAALSEFPDLFKICDWAQNTHGISVGLHIHCMEMSSEEIQALCKLDKSKTRILVTRDVIKAMRHLEEEHGLQLCVADPHPEGVLAPCENPGRMVFVNTRGELYTCGLVEGREDYKLGNVFEDSFKKIVGDPNLPHQVPYESAMVPHGCDGCPPLVTQYFGEGGLA